MGKDAEAVKMVQMRKLILSNLNRLYPMAVQVRTLYRVMVAFDEHYDISLLAKDLAYLKAKGFLFYVDEAIGGADRFVDKCVSLTAEGKEIADRTQTDPALEI